MYLAAGDVDGAHVEMVETAADKSQTDDVTTWQLKSGSYGEWSSSSMDDLV